jgi:hypothetical protein
MSTNSLTLGSNKIKNFENTPKVLIESALPQISVIKDKIIEKHRVPILFYESISRLSTPFSTFLSDLWHEAAGGKHNIIRFGLRQ